MNTAEKIRRRLRSGMLEIILIALCVFLAFKANGFLSTRNLLEVLRNVSMSGIIAFGMTMVIIAGEIDLSVGSAVAFSGCLAAWLIKFLSEKSGLPMPVAVVIAMLASLAAGFGVGSFSGFLRVHFRVPTFISTLAWLTILRGAAELITNGFPITPFPPWFNFLGGGHIGIIPFPAVIFIFVFAVIQVLMSFTSFGRAIYAVGGNAEAARLSGINVGRVKILVMGIVTFLAALAGLLQSSQIMSGSAGTAVGWELDVISAVIIGGASLMGGAGRVWSTLVGVIFLGVLVNGMTLMNVSEYWQHVVRGGLILTAVLINLSPASRK
jgi:ribose/xylose/arabinose/galactoside ABC-type transport system permease subunit